MEEEILKGLSRIISADSPNKRRMAELVDNTSEKSTEEMDSIEINDTEKRVIFPNEFMQDSYFTKNKKEILDYIHSQGYTTNLD